MSRYSEKRLVSTREAARVLGVGPTTIKRWADAGILPSARTAGGHRRFPLQAVHARLREAPSADQDPFLARWLEVLLGQQAPRGVFAELVEGRARLGSWWRLADRLDVVVSEIGRLWESGDCSIPEEHIATHLMQRGLAASAATLPVSATSPWAVLATAEGDAHLLGLSLVEVCARESGFNCEWIGGPTPARELAQAIRKDRPRIVLVSGSEHSNDEADLLRQHTLLAAACRDSESELIVGGRARWPDQPAYGYRLGTFSELHRTLRSLA